MRVVVVGAGPTGLFTGMALARQGHRVTVVDRDTGPRADGSWSPGRPGESHPRAPTERNVTVSRHSALLIHPSEVGHPCPVDEEIRLSSLRLIHGLRR